jgi:hypothetical protein
MKLQSNSRVLWLSRRWPAGALFAPAAAMFALVSIPFSRCEGGIPEPDLVWYGKILAASGGVPVRVTSGTLTWQIELVAGGTPWTLSTPVTNLNDQFSFLLRVPCETPELGVTATPSTVVFTATPTAYRRLTVTLDGQPLTLSSAPSQFSPVPANRGRSERIDLILGTLPPDSDGDGLSDAWELQFFGAAGANPNDDPDGDGLSNLREYRAGTNPTDAQSRFELVEIASSPSGVQVRWTSQPNRKYRVRRSATLLAAPAAYQVLQSGLEATPPFNEFFDSTVAAGAQFFYLIQLED